MSTPCIIIREREDGRFEGISCHYDGYLAAAGKTMVTCYNSPRAAQALIELGNIRSLKPDIDSITRYDEPPVVGYR